MADRIQNLVNWLQRSGSMTRFSDSGDEEEMANGVINKRPRFSESSSQSQIQLQPRRPIHPRACPSCRVEDVIPLQEVESDSDFASEGFEGEDDDEEIDAEEEEEDFGSEEDEGADGVAEGQHQQHHVTASTAASSQPRQANSSGGSRSFSGVAAALNNAHGAIPVLLTDPDVMDCPICLDPLCTPIFQCENGHIACSSCCVKVKHKCPSCCFPIGFNRCRAMEKLIESLRVKCKNMRHGCKETLLYRKKAEHEQVCPHTICFCPHSSCGYASSSKNLIDHFSSYHRASATSFTYDTAFSLSVERIQKHVFLRERNEGVIFILNHDIQGHGRVVNVDCIGPGTFNRAFVYQLSAKCMETSLSVQSVPQVHAKWEQHTPRKNHLTIPYDFLANNGLLSIQACIKKAQPVT